jgi:rSAM/selenodomain-associated transferase 2
VSVSVIIPAWNEEERIAVAIDRAWTAGADEVIVAEAGSDDSTRAITASCRCQLVGSPRGRAAQQNAGAAAATGNVLLFLHADTWLPPGAIDQIRSAIRDPRIVFGAFEQRIEAPGWRYRLLERGNTLRAKRFRLPYGDQGIFVRRSTFLATDGFPHVRLMEDVLLMRRLARHGRPAILPGPLMVSPRRWEKHGIARQTARNWFLLAAHSFGASPDWLARYYQ